MVEREEGADRKSIQEALIKILASDGLTTLHLSGDHQRQREQHHRVQDWRYSSGCGRKPTRVVGIRCLVLDTPQKIQSLVQAAPQ